MPLLLILLLSLACMPESWSAPGSWIEGPWQSVLMLGSGVGTLIGLALWTTCSVRMQLQRPSAELEEVFRYYCRRRRWHLLGLLALYLLALYVFGFGWALYQLWAWNGSVMPGVDLLVLAPFFLVMVLSWAIYHDADRAFVRASGHEPVSPPDPFEEKRWAYAWFQARQQLVLVLPPLALLLIQKELRRHVPFIERIYQTHGDFVLLCVASTVFLCMPWILRCLMGLKPLPAGPLRDRLLRTAQRVGFRFNNVLFWNTRNRIANAMVLGAAPFLRYVLLSDRLIDEMSEDEIEAVFGHEIGHVRHHHVLFYFLFLFTSIFLLGLIITSFAPDLASMSLLEDREDLLVLPTVVLLAVYLFFVFGFLSRRCERQADIFGCRVASCTNPNCEGHHPGQELAKGGNGLCPTGIHTFYQALEKVAILNGISRDKPGFLSSWQHSTIAKRVEFLQSLEENPAREARFQWRVLALKCGLMAVLGGLLLSEWL